MQTIASAAARCRAASFVLAAALPASVPAWAADAPQAQPPLIDEWRFEASLYGYMASLHGSTRFPGLASSITVDSSTIIDDLKFTLMGSFEARRQAWGVYTDIFYVDAGGSKQRIRNFELGGTGLPAGTTASGSLDVKSTVWTLAASYRGIARPEASLDLLLGMRLLDVRQTLDWQLAGNIASVASPGTPSSATRDGWR